MICSALCIIGVVYGVDTDIYKVDAGCRRRAVVLRFKIQDPKYVDEMEMSRC